ncbi:uncharacterized protein LY89DRAFT_719498 [Mollisia scopiformis]|uniref:DUF6594 domain-containing protein n=1 Tax=Mollisia scopiformis TaxID=149040 RepID=A0A194X6J4_MOLSC|nr:uncharacterized protein LY89DRAFT_719498 [Mollisia scopiformis]KUJ15788.1 hypothetical protein LY89DRAFT_719498 [Mollisia scopiformis]
MSSSTGYHKLSSFMVDKNYTIFRRFKVLANRDLLYLQAELAALEDQFAAIQAQDRVSGGEQEFYDRNWPLVNSSKDRGHSSEQLRKALEIRTKLQEYYECASRYATIINMPKARRRDVAMLKEWILSPDLGGGILFSGEDLSPWGKSVYDETHNDDLMIVKSRTGENDTFTRFLAGPVFHLLERFWRRFKKPETSNTEEQVPASNLYHYSDSHIIGTIDVMGTVIASMIPLVSIVILYFIRNLGARLGVVCAFTLLFSTGLALVTKARRIEIFACTAAFASVQVVFSRKMAPN